MAHNGKVLEMMDWYAVTQAIKPRTIRVIRQTSNDLAVSSKARRNSPARRLWKSSGLVDSSGTELGELLILPLEAAGQEWHKRASYLPRVRQRFEVYAFFDPVKR
jgi:hypothetical protein